MSALRHHRHFAGTFEGAAAASAWLHEVTAAERLDDKLVFALELCLEELFTNVVRHGGADSTPLGVDVALEIAGHEVDLIVSDNGRPFDIAEARGRPVGASIEDTAPGGLGVQLIRSFSNDLRYEPLPGGNRVIVNFLRQQPAEAKAGA